MHLGTAQFQGASNVFYPQNAAMMKIPRKSETFLCCFPYSPH